MTEHTRIPLLVPDLRGNEADYLMNCVRDNWVSSAGPYVTQLEEELATLASADHCVAVVNGTCAIELILRALGVGEGKKVIVPDWTFVATVNAIIHAGATPLFVDISPNDWALDPEKVESCLNEHDDVAAIVLVHALGTPGPVDELRRIAKRYNVYLVEDAAGAIGATYDGKPVGALGHAGAFSFNGNKLVTAGGGGAIVTNDEMLAQKARALSTQARASNRYQHDLIGHNYRMTNLNAAVAIAQLERLADMLEEKHRIFASYDQALADVPAISLRPTPVGRKSNDWMYCISLDTPEQALALQDELLSQRIDARLFWESISSQAPYAQFPKMDVPVSTDLSGRVLSLPASTNLDSRDQDRVIAAIRSHQSIWK